jgi:hypothetical protein
MLVTAGVRLGRKVGIITVIACVQILKRKYAVGILHLQIQTTLLKSVPKQNELIPKIH